MEPSNRSVSPRREAHFRLAAISRRVEQAADVFAAFEQRHAVPALRGGQRRLQSSRSSPDHGNLEGLVRLDAQRVLPLIARARIDGAGDVEQLAGVPGAAFVAAKADPR